MREFSRGEWRALRDGVFVARMEPAGVNAGLVVGDHDVLLIDAGSSPAQGADLAASAAQVVGRPVTTVVITHWHFDHFFGLPGVPGVESYGHDSLMAHLAGEDPDLDPAVIRDELGFDPHLITATTHTVSLAKGLDLGGRRVEIVHPGPAHSDGDLCVFVPDAGIVFTGDIVETSGDPAVGPDSSVEQWPSALEEVLEGAGHDPDTLFVPGHGEPVGAEFVADQRAQLASLWAVATQAVEEGQGVDDVVADLNGPRTRDWPWPAASVAAALPFLLDEVRRHGVTRHLPIREV